MGCGRPISVAEQLPHRGHEPDRFRKACSEDGCASHVQLKEQSAVAQSIDDHLGRDELAGLVDHLSRDVLYLGLVEEAVRIRPHEQSGLERLQPIE